MRLWPSVAAAGTNPQTGSVSGGALPGRHPVFFSIDCFE